MPLLLTATLPLLLSPASPLALPSAAVTNSSSPCESSLPRPLPPPPQCPRLFPPVPLVTVTHGARKCQTRSIQSVGQRVEVEREHRIAVANGGMVPRLDVGLLSQQVMNTVSGHSFRVRIIRNGRVSTSGSGGGRGSWAFRPGEKFLIATPPRPFCCS
ncbi:hypothetical protein BGW80DRAFT_1268517, partial [Lactifluus volemus]